MAKQRLFLGGARGVQQPHDHGATVPRIPSAIQLTWSGWFEALEQVVVRHGADGRRLLHPATGLSSSITLWTSSLASPICSTTIAISSAGRPGSLALWQYTPCCPTIARASVSRSMATA